MQGIKKEESRDFSLAGESQDSQEYTALPSRLERFAEAHKRALSMADYIAKRPKCKENFILRVRLNKCGKFLLFRDYYTVQKIRLHKAEFCMKHLLCPMCGLRRGAKAMKAYMDRLEVILKECKGITPYMVTLTVKNGPDLHERYKHLHSSYQKMNQQRINAKKGKRGFIEMSKAMGGVNSYEFKRGKNSNEWHPHCHAVWLCNEAPDVLKLAQEWKEITGDSFIVHVVPFYDDPVKGFLEVFRYALKFSEMELEDNFRAFQILSGRRLINSFGVFRGVVVPDDLADEPLEDLPFVDLLYLYRPGAGYEFVPCKDEIEIAEQATSAT